MIKLPRLGAQLFAASTVFAKSQIFLYAYYQDNAKSQIPSIHD